MAISHRLPGLAIPAARLFWLAVAVCLVVAPLSAACCSGVLCGLRHTAPNLEKHCHESMGTPSSPQSVAARATGGCDSMNSALEAIREEFRLYSSKAAQLSAGFSSLLADDAPLPQQISVSQFLRQSSFSPILDPFSSAVFPLRT